MEKGKIGRPRSEKARQAVMIATHDLLTELGWAGMTMESIARRSGVGKPTLYRWWSSLADIVLEALLQRAETEIGVLPDASFRQMLRTFLRQSMKSLDWGGVHLRFMMAQAQKDEAFRERFRENFVAKRRAALRQLCAQAVDQGEIDPKCNVDLLIDMVFGAMWYRLLVGHDSMDVSFADELTEMIVGAVQAPLT